MNRSGFFKTQRVFIALAGVLFFLSLQSVGAQTAPPGAGSGGPEKNPLAAVDLFVESSEDMFGNAETIKEMVHLLKTTAVEKLEFSGFQVRPLETMDAYKAAPEAYLLKITLINYARSGPQRILFARYELTRNGQILLKDKKKVGTIAGSSKLVRVLGAQIAHAVRDRLLDGAGKGQGQNSPEN